MSMRPEALDSLLSYWLGTIANEHVDDGGNLGIASHELAWKLMDLERSMQGKFGSTLLFTMGYELGLRLACAIMDSPLADHTSTITAALDRAKWQFEAVELESHATGETWKSIGKARSA